MLKQLRLDHSLTRSELAEKTGRSENYILKAEQLAFPSFPIALLDFYLQLDPNLTKPLLEAEYRQTQRNIREKWLDDFIPSPKSPELTFRRTPVRSWVYRNERDLEQFIYPSEYRYSRGLCVPASSVYKMERTGLSEKHYQLPKPVITALSDLVEYILSGRFEAAHLGDDNPSAQDVSINVLALAKESGVDY